MRRYVVFITIWAHYVSVSFLFTIFSKCMPRNIRAKYCGIVPITRLLLFHYVQLWEFFFCIYNCLYSYIVLFISVSLNCLTYKKQLKKNYSSDRFSNLIKSKVVVQVMSIINTNEFFFSFFFALVLRLIFSTFPFATSYINIASVCDKKKYSKETRWNRFNRSALVWI